MDIILDNEELQKSIAQFLNKELPVAIQQALERGCLLVENEAKANCPVDDGQLRQSITHDVEITEHGAEAVIGSNVEYAPYVEVGTGVFASNGDGRKTPWRYQDAKGDWHTTSGMAAQPFLMPAAQSNSQEIIEGFRDLL